MDAIHLAELNAFQRYHDLPGSKPAVVFIPGSYLAGTGAFAVTAAQSGLRDRRRLIVDLLGGGFSDRPHNFSYTLEGHANTIARLLDHLGMKGVPVVGHSLGGAVAIALAAERPDLVGSLILAEANLDPVGGPLTRLITSQPESDFAASGFDKLLADRRSAANDGNPTASIALGLFGTADPIALHRTAAGVAKGTEPIMRDLLRRMTIPRLYLFGESSLPDKDYEDLPTYGVEVGIVRRAGHAMPAENPSAFAEAIEAFLKKTEE